MPAEVFAARRLLERMTRLRLEVAAMNRERIYGSAAPDRRAQPVRRPGDLRPGLVTATGEYLIAWRLGVMDALRRWDAATLRLAQR
jgi:hypothetical protein